MNSFRQLLLLFLIILTLHLTLAQDFPKLAEEEESHSGKDSCKVSEDCNKYPYFVCDNEYCEHKGVFPPYLKEVIGLLVLAVLMSLSTIAGVGGGGVVTPMLMTFFVMDTKSAIAISGFSILTCSVTRYVLKINQKHPERKECVVIDYGLASVMLPTVLMGSLVGVLVNVMLPGLIL